LKKLVLATNNANKAAEIKALLKDLEVEVLTLQDYPGMKMPEEDRPDFAGNAAKKAEAVAAYSGLPAMADDSGLEVEALKGRPGVRSARYAGEDSSDRENNVLLLKELAGIPPQRRGARFRCAVAVAVPGRQTEIVEGSCAGRIAEKPAGENGFGYDPLFIYEPEGLTFAQMSREAKNRVSHRGIALAKARKLIRELL